MRNVSIVVILCLFNILFSNIVHAEEGGLRLYCVVSPVKSEWAEASPLTFEKAIYDKVLHQELDEHGEKIVWSAAHWVEVNEPILETNNVALDEEMKYEVKSHLVIFRGFWTYDKDGNKKEWVRRTVNHITAGAADGRNTLKVSTEKITSGRYRIVKPEGDACSNVLGSQEIKWKGKTIGWASVAWLVREGNLLTKWMWYHSNVNPLYIKDTRNILHLKGRHDYNTSITDGKKLDWSFVLSRTGIGNSTNYHDPAQDERNIIIPPKDTAVMMVKSAEKEIIYWWLLGGLGLVFLVIIGRVLKSKRSQQE